jgi:hypothetical protein
MRLIDADKLVDKLLTLTIISDDGYCKGRFDERDDILKRIADMPTVEAVVFPCKIGDSVYLLNNASRLTKPCFEQVVIESIRIVGDNEVYFIHGMDDEFEIADIGETVFLTREEAEAKLAKKGASE